MCDITQYCCAMDPSVKVIPSIWRSLLISWYVSFNILSVKCCLPYMKDPFEKDRPIKQ